LNDENDENVESCATVLKTWSFHEAVVLALVGRPANTRVEVVDNSEAAYSEEGEAAVDRNCSLVVD